MWRKGALKVNNCWYQYWIKVYDEPSEYGIDGGRVSKVIITRKDETVCNYDRGWGIKPLDEDTEKVLQIILFSENK